MRGRVTACRGLPSVGGVVHWGISTYPPTPVTGLSMAALLDACRRRGHDVTPDKIRRWSQRGLLDVWFRRGGGRGRGTAVVWPRDTVERVAIIAPIMRTGRNVTVEAALALLRGGYTVRGQVLRYVLAWSVGCLDSWFIVRGYPHDTPDIAGRKRWVVQGLRRHIGRVLGRRMGPIPDALADALATMVVAFNDSATPTAARPRGADPLYSLARGLSPEALRRVLNAVPDGSGGDAMIEHAWSMTAPIVPMLEALLTQFIPAFADILGLNTPPHSTHAAVSSGLLDDSSVVALRLFITLGIIAATTDTDALAATTDTDALAATTAILHAAYAGLGGRVSDTLQPLMTWAIEGNS